MVPLQPKCKKAFNSAGQEDINQTVTVPLPLIIRSYMYWLSDASESGANDLPFTAVIRMPG